ncbi:MAG TPA: response regulator transcription factor [Bacillota bacterium]|nr:response regulator transcription factor [Bacillota bacterium]
MGSKILIVDDEPAIVELVKYNLEREGFSCLVAEDGEQALDIAQKESPDLIVLDIMLPKKDGYAVCRELRAMGLQMLILMLSAKGEEIDRVLGLEIGADDYLPKPFSTRELVARVKAMLRRQELAQNPAATSVLRVGEVELDQERFEVKVRGKKVDLTPKEFELLHLLMQNPGKVLTRDMLLIKGWDFAYDGGSRTVDVHVRRLREKIEENPAEPKLIETVYGVGYRFRDQSED